MDYVTYKLKEQSPIPLFLCSIIQKLQYCVETYGSLKSITKKTNMPSKNAQISLLYNETSFKNIKTTRIKNKVDPYLVINYSNIPLSFYGIQKLVLGHKMYGFPYLDKKGEYGISNRDNYVIINKSIEDLIILKKFLSTEMVMTLYDSTRYRMKYLEKYIFEMLPDITNIPYFKNNIVSDEVLFDYFKLTIKERNYIKERFKHKYNSL
jgi:hypothetical protein